jgi:arylsulfatase A-like enzyme
MCPDGQFVRHARIRLLRVKSHGLATGALAAIVAIVAACTTEGSLLPDRPINLRVGPDHPNVLIIMTDDQRADGTMRVMPATRRWFSDGGTMFSRAYATTPLCCPSRASVFTGHYAHNHGVRSNVDISAFDFGSTIQRLLHGEGYRTAIVGKFLNRWPIEQAPPDFDIYTIFSPRVEVRSYFGTTFNDNGSVHSIDGYSTDFIRERSLEFLEAFEDQDPAPWFLVVTPFAPHFPAEYPQEYQARPVPGSFRPTREFGLGDKPPFIRESDRPSGSFLRRVRRRQLRSLMPVDKLVAEVATRLRELDEEDNTLAFFLSDNGFMWGEHNLEGKNTPYLTSVRIPLLVRWPSGEHPTVDDRLAGTIDIAPTIVSASGLGASASTAMDGDDLAAPKTRKRLLLEFWADRRGTIPTWSSILTRTEQYIEYREDDGTVIHAEYYDLSSDPEQFHNLLVSRKLHPPVSRIDQLDRLLARDRVCSGAECP